MKHKTTDTLVCRGDSVKALDDGGLVGGYLVRFSSAKDPDMVGEYFTAKTYFGARDGDGADALFHHGFPLKSGLEALADHVFQPIKTRRDEIGIWAEVVLDLSDKYEKKVHELAAAGKLGWSSGTAKYLVKTEDDGQITRWPIVEGSLTPTPAEPRNRAAAVKSLDEFLSDLDARPAVKAAINSITKLSDCEDLLREAAQFSKSDAVAFIARIKAVAQGEPEELAALKRKHAETVKQLVAARAEILSARYQIPKSLRS